MEKGLSKSAFLRFSFFVSCVGRASAHSREGEGGEALNRGETTNKNGERMDQKKIKKEIPTEQGKDDATKAKQQVLWPKIR